MSGPDLGFGVNTYPYTQSCRAADAVRRLAGAGFRRFELMLIPGHLWVTDDAATLRETRRALDEQALDLVTLNTANLDLNLAAAAEEVRALSLDLCRGFVRIAGELGARAFVLGPGKPNPLFPLPFATMEGHFFRALDVLLPLAERAGIEFWVENMPFAFMPRAGELIASLDRHGSDQLKVCYDVANAHFIGEDPVEGLRIVEPRLALVHLSDTTRAAYRHDPVGKGDIDFARLAGAVARACPDRPPVLEIIADDPDRVLPDSARALLDLGFCRN